MADSDPERTPASPHGIGNPGAQQGPSGHYVHASLFGSFARGEATTTSDIDILVVTGPAGAADQDERAAQLEKLSADILMWTGNRGHILDPTPDILATMIAAEDSLVVSWRADHIHLVGERLLDLLRNAS
jgi:predicted nucleotidyltransferase